MGTLNILDERRQNSFTLLQFLEAEGQEEDEIPAAFTEKTAVQAGLVVGCWRYSGSAHTSGKFVFFFLVGKSCACVCVCVCLESLQIGLYFYFFLNVQFNSYNLMTSLTGEKGNHQVEVCSGMFMSLYVFMLVYDVCLLWMSTYSRCGLYSNFHMSALREAASQTGVRLEC